MAPGVYAHSLDEGLPTLVIALYGNLVGQECIVPAHNRVLNETTTAFGNLLLHFLSVQELLIVPKGNRPGALV
jgi:hypothetical protein